ncbi:MAG TPA: DUF3459 domain-containing protein, partial [Amnibacterium sp.]
DGCRVPLPWTTEGGSFGFGDDGAHLPQPEWFGEHAVAAQDGVDGSMLELYRQALALRHRLPAAGDLAWRESDPEVLHFERSGGWHVVVNLGTAPAPLPAGEVLLASAPVTDGALPADAAAWIRGSSSVSA